MNTPINSRGDLYMATMGQRIKLLREERKYTQEQFGAMIGVSKSTIGMYEVDRREPDKEKLETIADFFNVDMDFLYGKSNYRNKQEWLLSQTDLTLNTAEENLLTDFRILNNIGQDKAIDYVSDLADNPKYQKEDCVHEPVAPYVPEVLAAHHETGKLDDEDRDIINNALQFVGELKQKNK